MKQSILSYLNVSERAIQSNMRFYKINLARQLIAYYERDISKAGYKNKQTYLDALNVITQKLNWDKKVIEINREINELFRLIPNSK